MSGSAPNRFTRSTICVGLALLFVFATPSQGQAAEFDHAGLARQMLERHIRPGYAQVASSADAFEKKAQTFCSSAETTGLAPLRDAFGTLVISWSRLDHLRFGPVANDRRFARFHYWPDRKGIGRRQIARQLRKQSPDVLDPKALAKKSVTIQGLGALEVLLFRESSQQAFAKPDERKFRCGYLLAIAANLSSISNKILDEWSPTGAFTKTFLQPGPDNPDYLNPSEVSLEIAKAFLVGLERLRDVRLAGHLGMRPNSRRKTRAAFRTSGLSTRALEANLHGLVSLFTDGGLQQSIARQEPGMGKSIFFELDQSLATLGKIKVPVHEATEGPETEDLLINIGFPLKNARLETARVLSEAAGLNLRFNALDGD